MRIEPKMQGSRIASRCAVAAALLNPGTELCRPQEVRRLAANVIIEVALAGWSGTAAAAQSSD